MYVPVAVSQILTVFSLDPDATSFEFGENTTQLTQSLCPSSVCVHAPVAASQILMVLSADPDASYNLCEGVALISSGEHGMA
jgi:hypothetical protein